MGEKWWWGSWEGGGGGMVLKFFKMIKGLEKIVLSDIWNRLFFLF
jgi:hypothetical protein